MVNHRDKIGKPMNRAGFTLIELLVVVAIIVILASLLIAAMTGAKKKAYDSATQSLLTGLSTNCEQYYAIFEAYPGPMGPNVTSGSAPNKISGTQNLLLGLSCGIYTTPYYGSISAGSTPSVPAGSGSPLPPSGGTWVTVPGSNPLGSVNTIDFSGPLNYSTTPPRSLAAFYSPSGKEAPLITTATGWNLFPTIVDKYADPLPLLYYRRTPGFEGSATSVATDAQGRITPITNVGTIVGANSNAAYYYNDNLEYTSSSALKSPSGSVYAENQALIAVINGPPVAVNKGSMPMGDLARAVSNVALQPNSTGLTVSARGSFVLISAGYDHLYGFNPKNFISDDIIVVGGQ